MILPGVMLLPLAQIKELTQGDPRFEEPSAILTLMLGALMMVLILLIGFKISKRNQAKE